MGFVDSSAQRKTMKLYVLSDVHVEFEPFDPPKVNADIIILAGDIHVKVWIRSGIRDNPSITYCN